MNSVFPWQIKTFNTLSVTCSLFNHKIYIITQGASSKKYGVLLLVGLTFVTPFEAVMSASWIIMRIY